MITKLIIKDYVLIDYIEINFGSGLNIITGETGAGKSILIDAINLLIGERASQEVIRTGKDKSIIEGVFNIADNKVVRNYLGENDFDINDELIIRREVNIKGNNRCFINDTPASLNNLKEVGKYLIDLHGQHEHQSLLRQETHIEMLDNYGGLEKLVEEYRTHFNGLNSIYKKLSELRDKEKSLREKKEFYEFQLHEIESVNPKENEDEELINRIKILENSEKLFESTQKLYEILYSSEQAAYDQLIKARNILEDLSKIDNIFLDMKNEASGIISIIDELSKVIQSYNSRIEFAPDLLEDLRERLGKITLLVKKYGGSLDNVLKHKDDIKSQLNIVENFDEEIKKLENEINKNIELCTETAIRLSKKRRETAEKISKNILIVLKELGIANPQFEVKIENEKITTGNVFLKLGNEPHKATAKGMDIVEFCISTNPGESVKPLVKVASGGEVSRIMLSLKTILAKSDRLPIMVFDEIDVGISGRIAQKVGRALKNLSDFHQIIAITHLPQIAAFSDSHFIVEKSEKGDKTTSTIKKINDEEKVREVAKLLSGEDITTTSMKTAKELINNNDK